MVLRVGSERGLREGLFDMYFDRLRNIIHSGNRSRLRAVPTAASWSTRQEHAKTDAGTAPRRSSPPIGRHRSFRGRLSVARRPRRCTVNTTRRTEVRRANTEVALIDKTVPDAAAAVRDVRDGATVMIGGFGRAGQPVELIDALLAQGATDLTIVNNNAGNGDTGLAALLAAGRVRKIVCSFPRQSDSWVFDELYRSGRIELELVPQGNLAERIRAAGAGIGAFFSPTGVGTPLAEGKERRTIDGRDYLLEYPIRADFALVSALKGDRWGNLVFRETARNFGPVMLTAATTSVVQVDEIVPLGSLDPESIVTPGIFVDRVVAVGSRPWFEGGRFVGGVDLEGRPLRTRAEDARAEDARAEDARAEDARAEDARAEDAGESP